jgi:outer membrane biogenesis lipoprotein LolB
MLEGIPKRTISAGLLLVGCALFVGCATQKPAPTLVNDPDAKHESSLPWNKQEKWEQEGQFAGMNEQHR